MKDVELSAGDAALSLVKQSIRQAGGVATIDKIAFMFAGHGAEEIDRGIAAFSRRIESGVYKTDQAANSGIHERLYCGFLRIDTRENC